MNSKLDKLLLSVHARVAWQLEDKRHFTFKVLQRNPEDIKEVELRLDTQTISRVMIIIDML